MGPFTQHMSKNCDTCQGQGKIYKTCSNCQEGTITVEKLFDLPLTPETNSSGAFVFAGQGNQTKGKLAGDFIVKIEIRPHQYFERQDSHLKYRKKITLLEALLGFTFEIAHPSGEILKIEKLDITHPNFVQIVKNKGMTSQADLEIIYEIIFPLMLTEKQRQDLSKIL
jgi:DnaJ-class molecular chaperone